MSTTAELLGVTRLADDLTAVEAGLKDAVQSVDPFLTEIAGHLARAGGKRLRPALCVAAALVSEDRNSDTAVQASAVRGGVSVELVHLGSLYHDDVMDEAAVRRNVDSVNARWGNLVAILAGDFLLARASEIAATLGTEVAGLLAATIARLCEGQVSELQSAFSLQRTEESYLRAIRGKTAALTAAACRIGGLVSTDDRTAIDALTEFGEAFGMAFQIRDDILDIVATDAKLGKPAGQDLVEGVYNLPVIRALAVPDAGAELAGLLGRPVDRPERDKARDIIKASGAIEASAAAAQQFARDATAALSRFDGPVADALRGAPARLLADVP